MKRITIVMLMLFAVGACISCTSDGKTKQAVVEAMNKALGGSGSAAATPAELAAAAQADQDAHNLAARYVHAEVADAKCTDYYVDAGSNHAYSARCTLAGGTVVYASIDDTSGPRIANLTPQPAPVQKPPAKAPGK